MPSTNVRLAPAGSTIEARVAALEMAMKKVGALADGALQIGPNQRSIVPGELIAGRITTPLPPNQPHMTLDMIRNGAGQGPIATVSDGTFNRAQMGNLADYVGPNGVDSPAQYGFRALNAQGNAIFDSLGLVSVMSQPTPATHGGNSIGNPSQNFTTAAYTLVTDGGTPAVSAAITITPTRTLSYLFLMDVVVQGPSAGTQGGSIEIFLDGSQAPNSMTSNFGNTSATSTLYQTQILFHVVSLKPASHTIDLRILTNSATYSVFDFDLYGFQLGS